MYEALKLILVFGAILGSLKSTIVLGRTVNMGDFFALGLIPFLLADWMKSSRSGKKVIGSVEIIWMIYIASLALQAIIVGELMNGAFLNGYRTLVLSFALYFTGRACNTETRWFKWQMFGFFAAFAYLLNEYKSEFSADKGGDTTHLVGFEGGELGLNVTNLNLYGLLWALLVLLSIAVHLRSRMKSIPSLVIIVALPGIIASASRAAVAIYAALLLFFLYTIATKEGALKAIALPLGLVSAMAIAFTKFSTAGDAVMARLSDKADLFWEELFSERIGYLMSNPISEFLSRADGTSLIFGEFQYPQHNCIANALVMFGISGLCIYLALWFAHLQRGIAIIKHSQKKNALGSTRTNPIGIKNENRHLGLLYIGATALFFANDLATNILYYSASVSYMFFFALGLLHTAPTAQMKRTNPSND